MRNPSAVRRYAPHLVVAALTGLTFASSAATAAPARLLAAIDTNDITALEALSGAAATADERRLATGAALALRRKDAAASVMLARVTRSTAGRELRAAAYLALAGVELRDGRYRACHSSIRSASRLAPHLVHYSDRQAMAFAAALATVPPMRLVHAASGSLPITPDKAGLSRVPVGIDGHVQDAIIDTGAQFSTISASAARRAGMRLLRQAATVASATERAVPTRLAVASRLRIGNALLTNVVFIVLPDSALSFANGAYRIDAIVGLPVFIALRRIGYVSSGTKSTFVYGASWPGRPGATESTTSNLLLSGLEPLLLVHVPGAANPLRLLLDTGANSTILARNALTAAPVLLAHAEGHGLRFGGAGGGATDRNALRLPTLTLIFGGRRFRLRNVAVTSRAKSGSEGTVGADALRQSPRISLDFAAMKLTAAS